MSAGPSMNCASANAKALLLTVAVVAACQDPARAPIPLTVSSDPPAQTAGGIITLTSDQFSGLTLLPSPDTLRTNRSPHFSRSDLRIPCIGAASMRTQTSQQARCFPGVACWLRRGAHGPVSRPDTV